MAVSNDFGFGALVVAEVSAREVKKECELFGKEAEGVERSLDQF